MLPNNHVRVPPPRAAVPRDITAEFTQAASQLALGQLIKDETFTLFDGVGALEIMDSKMDSGYISPGENQVQALEDDYDVRRELTPEEIVGLMDQLLCHEMAWHMGHPLSQTLFTSIYIDRLLWPVPRTMEDARFDRVPSESPLVSLVLRSYCLALVKACDYVHSRVVVEFYFEEEDFVSQLYNRNLLSSFDGSHFYRLLEEAIVWVEAQHSIDKSLRDAIVCRLKLRYEFLAALDSDLEILETRSVDKFVESLAIMESLASSVSLGKQVPEAFSLKIQRKLASTVPPRPIVQISNEDALAHLKRLCQDAIDLLEIVDYSGPGNFKMAVSTLLSRKPQPSVYIRCVLQALIVSDMMTIMAAIPAKQLIYEDIAELVLPSSIILEASKDETEVPSDPRFQIAQLMEGFVKKFAPPFVDTIRYTCVNRCRTRRALCHSAIDWDNLQVEAEELDLKLQALSREVPLKAADGEASFSYPLSSWSYHQKLVQLRLIVQMGFELSLYAPEELAGMYWYLSHLCTTHLGHLDRIRTFMMAASKRDLQMTGDKPTDWATRKSAAFRKSFRHLERLTTNLIAIDAFAIALHGLYVVLDRHRALPYAAGPGAYSTGKLRYDIRMKPFIPISLPEVIPYEDFLHESTLEGDSDIMIIERSSKAIVEARRALDMMLTDGAFEYSTPPKTPAVAIGGYWKADVKDSMRACIGTSIAIGMVQKTLTNESSGNVANLQVEIPQIGSKSRWHDWWITPQISQKKADS
ncbi:hypothetical protein N7495_008661 [Penicillium taxi]|uniref:uncharacterized protein n=1 Tax=Penicillium taxi TaxID=168475 RepID=UPI0025453F60|nr:uncharacterized protein N7495_008661 [Penicillium taxi]KAJ5888620.1 hypothetical protein N7495_008661 [Penicillium taxi]